MELLTGAQELLVRARPTLFFKMHASRCVQSSIFSWVTIAGETPVVAVGLMLQGFPHENLKLAFRVSAGVGE